MILDAFAQFTGWTNASAPALAGNADGTDSPTTGTQTSSGALDLHILGIPASVVGGPNQGRDLGVGDDPALKLNIQVVLAFTGGTSLQVALQGAPDSGTGTPGTFTTMVTGAVVNEALLIPGAQLLPMDVPRPPQGMALPRYLQLQYISAGTHGAGKIRGNIVLDRFDQPWNATNDAILGGYMPGIVINN